jgi:uncharacterized protein YbbK (DUF523 family)
MILVSACLVGVDCKYSGENNDSQGVRKYLEGKVYVPICPEQLGGLQTPRPCCEIVADRVMNEHGLDCTKEFLKGAEETLKIAKLVGATEAVLKEGSPSCGSNKIYDGTFSGVKIKGQGFTANLLRKNGLKILSDTELEEK